MNIRSPVGAVLILGTLIAFAIVSAGPVARATSAPQPSAAMTDLLDYLKSHRTTGFLVIQDGKALIEKNWPAPEGDRAFQNFVYERNAEGALLEDVASQQKSFVSLLIAIAIDRGLIDVQQAVSAYIGAGWSKATPEQETKIRVIDVLTMSSGLNDRFGFEAPPGTLFYYNTPVYAATKRIVAAAAKQPLDVITRDWLTAPLGMKNTAWRKRPAALASVGNDTGLVTTPRDSALVGLMILHDGLANGGKRVVSKENLQAMFTRSPNNPAYGRLWWLNGSAYTVRALAGRQDGPLIKAAPADLVAALGAFGRRLYIVPSRRLVVVRAGADAQDKEFDEQLWLRLMKVIN